MNLIYQSTGDRRIYSETYPVPVRWFRNTGGKTYFQNMLTGKFYEHDTENEVEVSHTLYKGDKNE